MSAVAVGRVRPASANPRRWLRRLAVYLGTAFDLTALALVVSSMSEQELRDAGVVVRHG